MLTGFVPNVPIACGDVVTHASIFIGDKVPFDLLLGRPWQRGNFISIDERLEGTYLLFKDQHMRVRYELLVTPDMSATHNPEITDYLARAGTLYNYMIQVQHPSRPLSDIEVVRIMQRGKLEVPLPVKRHQWTWSTDTHYLGVRAIAGRYDLFWLMFFVVNYML